jgi:hypothetical protein
MSGLAVAGLWIPTTAFWILGSGKIPLTPSLDR